MYPVVRLLWQFWLHRKSSQLPPLGIHESNHICLPQDIELWRELNNGRTLTLYDMGRLPLAKLCHRGERKTARKYEHRAAKSRR